MDREARAERRHWRDEGLSERHRLWGWDCPAVDLDFVLIEYDKGVPMGLVEYKCGLVREQDYSSPSYRAMVRLADRSCIPAFECRYSRDFSQWMPIPLNDFARAVLMKPTVMSERDWVRLLYAIRGTEVPQDVLDRL